MENELIKEKIARFLEGVLTVEEEAELLKWITENEGQRAHFLREQENFSPALAWSADDAVGQKWENLRSRIGKTGISQGKKIRMNPWLSAAAVLLMAMIITSVLFFITGRDSSAELQMVTLRIPHGAKSRFMLPDSSNVWINSGSELSYPSSFRKERRVSLIGEAYFEVRKDAMPFSVETSYGKVEVTGTEFDVKAYKGDNMFTTTLVTGAVTVCNPSGTVVLKPGEQSFVTNNKLTVKKVDTELYTSWKDGKLIFVREPFPGLMKKLELWYNVKIDFSDPKLSAIWYTGTIEMETITEVMEMVSKAEGVKYSFNSKTRVITIKSR